MMRNVYFPCKTILSLDYSSFQRARVAFILRKKEIFTKKELEKKVIENLKQSGDSQGLVFIYDYEMSNKLLVINC